MQHFRGVVGDPGAQRVMMSTLNNGNRINLNITELLNRFLNCVNASTELIRLQQALAVQDDTFGIFQIEFHDPVSPLKGKSYQYFKLSTLY
jgi:hypothetical protein